MIVVCLAVSISGFAATGPKADVNTTVQDASQNPEEVFLSFSYRGTERVVITALYQQEDDQIYLPVGELFELLVIPYHTDMGSLTISGTYLSQEQSYELIFDDRSDPRGRVGERSVNFEAEDYQVGELDFYMKPQHFEKLFNLNFSVDMTNLTLSLTTDNVLPVVQRLERERRRQQIEEQQRQFEYYDLAYDRNRHFLRAGFVDYSLNTTVSPTSTNQYNYNLQLGGELLGGDLQGTVFGGYNTQNGFQNLTDNLRWRYVTDSREVVSSISAGQVRPGGLLSSGNFRGVRISNENIQPETLFQDYVIDGNTVPQSEVEVYINNSLIAFEEADMTGYYRFQIPLTYGTSQLSVRIFKPDGSMETRNRRLQIPFTFLRPGQFEYEVSAGRSETSLLSEREEFWQGQASASMGITPWLTMRTGMDYLEADSSYQPLLYGSLSARLASNYLLNVDAAPDAFYRANLNVVYPTSASFNASYTNYVRDRSLFNPTSIQEEFQGNLFVPFSLFSTPLSLRLFGIHQTSPMSDVTQYRGDLSGRFDRLNVRFSYRDRQTGPLAPQFTPNALLSTTATYIFPRGPSTAGLLKSLYIRAQMDYSPLEDQVTQSRLELSRDIGENLRFQLSVGRNFQTRQMTGQVNLTFDLNNVRSTSVARFSQDQAGLSQNLRGSVGYDGNYNELFFSNRRQVGQSAASVRLYVDENNSGSYTEGEQVLPYNAVRLQESGRTQVGDDGIIRITQMQSYYRHNVEINYAALQNPIYVPKTEQFSFIADPNQFKQIDIPFYITGILEGMVHRQSGDQEQPASGVRLYLVSGDGQFTKSFNTFSDGSFYTYEVPPGEYDLFVDRGQLQTLNAYSVPDTMDVTVEAVEDGDYLSGLDFTIVPEGEERRVITEAETPEDDVTTPLEEYGQYTHRVQLASLSSMENARQAMNTASSQFEVPLRVTETGDMFALRTLPIQNREQAIMLLHRVSDSQFSQPVLVLTRNGEEAEPSRTDSVATEEREVFSLQIGALGSREGADQLASRAEEETNRAASVAYDSTRQIYKVYAHPKPYSTLEEAQARLAQLRNQSPFEDAFIDRRTVTVREPATADPPTDDRSYTYEVHIQGVSDISREQFLTQAISTDYELLSNEPGEELVVFQEVSSWQDAVDLTGKLRRIAGMGRPFIVMIEEE